jgi:hypothetical protein
MRFITDCSDCGSVVVPATELGLVRQPAGDFHGMFDCPVCDGSQTVPVARVTAPALVARGAAVVPPAESSEPTDTSGPTGQPEAAALTLDDLAELQELLADDEACRRMLEEAI